MVEEQNYPGPVHVAQSYSGNRNRRIVADTRGGSGMEHCARVRGLLNSWLLITHNRILAQRYSSVSDAAIRYESRSLAVSY
jgi:hypothetical protein